MSAPTEANDPVSKHNTLLAKSLYWDGTKYVSNTATGFGAQSAPNQTAAGCQGRQPGY